VRLSRKLFFGTKGWLMRRLWPTAPFFDDTDAVVHWGARNWCRFAAWARERDVFLVRYEDLVKEPERQLQRICEYTGQPFKGEMLESDQRPAAFGGVGAMEVMFRPRKEISTRPIGRGRNLDADHRRKIREICGDRAARLNYSF
jgi:hypothetical protein